MRKKVLDCVALALTVGAVACSDGGPAPMSPTGAAPASTAADGPATLKASGPAALSPAAGSTVKGYRPTLVVSTARATYVDVPFSYEFELLSGTTVIERGTVGPVGGPEVSYVVKAPLTPDQLFSWRARPTLDGSAGEWVGSTFRTPQPPALGAICASSNPKQIIACIAAEFGYYLRGMPRDDAGRRENMIFLRDRIIEAGLCGGLEFGWNMKRGGPEKSIDFLAWRDRDGDNINLPGVEDWGVDIAFDWDNNAPPLHLHWEPHGIHAFFEPYYPPPVCGLD